MAIEQPDKPKGKKEMPKYITGVIQGGKSLMTPNTKTTHSITDAPGSDTFVFRTQIDAAKESEVDQFAKKQDEIPGASASYEIDPTKLD